MITEKHGQNGFVSFIERISRRNFQASSQRVRENKIYLYGKFSLLNFFSYNG